DLALYEQIYGVQHPLPELLKDALYGLPEIYHKEIQNAKIVGNPGCYPTSILLPVLPLLANRLIDPSLIISDSKSGVSGAGRAANGTTHYINCNESINAYKVGDTHRHLSEIQEQMRITDGQFGEVLFTPHLTPMARGILSTIYLDFAPGVSASQITECLKEKYADASFVHYVSHSPKTSDVSCTNNCHFNVYFPKSGKKIIILSVIDNLLKGAAGQAIQNMNIMFGFNETEGLV
ncbi:MAG: N-acetyl-gamma-glutamyl-phosphate reductase, partial [Fibrobacteria bacterium]|nr:N-acetyl-gamma-glutamyl-phosphate reductase [Fibrobacteria bacterium]